jgi:hypothetical protein
VNKFAHKFNNKHGIKILKVLLLILEFDGVSIGKLSSPVGTFWLTVLA